MGHVSPKDRLKVCLRLELMLAMCKQTTVMNLLVGWLAGGLVGAAWLIHWSMHLPLTACNKQASKKQTQPRTQ